MTALAASGATPSLVVAVTKNSCMTCVEILRSTRREPTRRSSAVRLFHFRHDRHKSLDRIEPVQRLDHAPHVERDVFVHDDVAETGQTLELVDEIGGKARILR